MTSNQILIVVAVVLAVLATIVIVRMVVIPFIKVELRRRADRAHIPQPQEIWIEDDHLIYIEAVGPTGVELSAVDGKTKQVTKWKDDWNQWSLRLQNRVVYFTGVKRPLGEA